MDGGIGLGRRHSDRRSFVLNLFCRQQRPLGLTLASYFQPDTVKLMVPLTLKAEGAVPRDEQLTVVDDNRLVLNWPLAIARIRLERP